MPVGTVFVDIEQLYKIHCDFVKIFISITYSSIGYWCYFLKPQLWSRNLCLIFCPLLLLLSRFCHVRLCETPETAAHEAPPSLGFSRQEHWSELPFPSPVLKVESESKVSVVSDSVQPHRLQPTRLPHPWDSPRKNTGLGCHFLLPCMKVKSESEVAQ